jgi:hypothetical protein
MEKMVINQGQGFYLLVFHAIDMYLLIFPGMIWIEVETC